MANAKHLAVLQQGVKVWNVWRHDQPTIRPDLSDIDLRNANLGEANLNGAQLTRAKLIRAHLFGADLTDADFTDADFTDANFTIAKLIRANLTRAHLFGVKLFGTDLTDANLFGARVSNAELTGANLTGANFTRANLTMSNLTDANLTETVFANAILGHTVLGDLDLRGARGLETVKHSLPSSIGVDTIYKSHGEIPELFLRGAGVPNSIIAYMASLVGKPLDFFSCFISHSHHDQAFCDRLYADLRAKGIRTWYFPEDAVMGRSVWGEIDRSIKIYDKLIVVCSESALHSRPVIREIERVLQREDREGKEILFPIRIDDYLFHAWEHPRKADVIERVVGDFRDAERLSAYTKEFERLLRGLKASEEG